jgi:hypothetical protein
MSEIVVVVDKALQYNLRFAPMSPDLKATTFRLEPELLEGLHAVKVRDGIPVTEQVRRALYAWLKERGIGEKKTGLRRASTRRKP